MSHILNLFQKASRHEQNPPTASAAAAPTNADVATAPPPVASATAIADFPVEEAQLLPESRLIVHTDPSGPATDRFRFLRMRLSDHWNNGNLKKLLVTSPLSKEGKSTVTMNLATALSERGKRTVLVVEADLHFSSMTKTLRLNPWTGLSQCLTGDIQPLSAIRRIEPLGWHLLPGGAQRHNPTELLQTPAFGQILQKLTPCFDWILIDSPPVLPLTDCILLRQHADACLLVVRAGQTPRDAVEQAIALLNQTHILGVVLNGVERRHHPYYQHRYYDASKRREED